MGTACVLEKKQRMDVENRGATENAGPGQCRTWKMTDQSAGLENARPEK